MEKDFKYSVLMSIYIKENPDYFKKSLDSMLNQTIKPDEIILVEDGPLTSELYAVIEEYKKSNPDCIKTVVNETNLGLGLALRKGLEHCKNELVARMDTDDIAINTRCEKQLVFMSEHPDVDIVGGQIEEFIGNENNIVGKRIVPCDDQSLKEYTKKRCPFNHMTVMFRKKAVQAAGDYMDLHFNEDYYLWIRMAKNNAVFANIKETLVFVRVDENMYQRRGGLKYFKSEKALQNLMLKSNMITLSRYVVNTGMRFVLQVMMPNKLRGIIFRLFARS